MTRPLETIVELQKALDEHGAARALLDGIPEWMRELHTEHSAEKAEIDALSVAADEAAAEQRTANAEAETLQEKLKTYQAQISQVRNQREYGALLHEIDATKEQIRLLEEAALQALERQETAKSALAERREAFTDLDQRYGVELEKWEAEKPAVAAEVERLEGRIETLRERLPRNVLDLFQRILVRYEGVALAPVLTVDPVGKGPEISHCGVCNYRVRPQAVVEIVNHGKIVPCDSCKRILYIEEADS